MCVNRFTINHKNAKTEVFDSHCSRPKSQKWNKQFSPRIDWKVRGGEESGKSDQERTKNLVPG